MIRYLIILAALLLASSVAAQSPKEPLKPLTVQLLMQQRPATLSVEDWQKVIANPASASLYPIRITQTMLDTVDASALDIRWQYVMVEEERQTPVQEQ
ncbi:MAG: hypothetical protein KA408_00575 [Flavobacteriales bacterium]|nr:hypothetical protein [Flavobacteriales bacterium]